MRSSLAPLRLAPRGRGDLFFPWREGGKKAKAPSFPAVDSDWRSGCFRRDDEAGDRAAGRMDGAAKAGNGREKKKKKEEGIQEYKIDYSENQKQVGRHRALRSWARVAESARRGSGAQAGVAGDVEARAYPVLYSHACRAGCSAAGRPPASIPGRASGLSLGPDRFNGYLAASFLLLILPLLDIDRLHLSFPFSSLSASRRPSIARRSPVVVIIRLQGNGPVQTAAAPIVTNPSSPRQVLRKTSGDFGPIKGRRSRAKRSAPAIFILPVLACLVSLALSFPLFFSPSSSLARSRSRAAGSDCLYRILAAAAAAAEARDRLRRGPSAPVRSASARSAPWSAETADLQFQGLRHSPFACLPVSLLRSRGHVDFYLFPLLFAPSALGLAMGRRAEVGEAWRPSCKWRAGEPL
ncbi:hypothetical protein CDD83_286 [Cordyceps sp. RAO-2017]|nr:hypothetical protein CDD83_286 [Cordyceps sp. RAO-2017]